jgi:endonuclease V-like protein UPF0215 family
MKNKKFRIIKPEIRILGIDDGPFTPHEEGEVLLVGTIFRGGSWLDGVLTTKVHVDGTDSTSKLIRLVMDSRNLGQLGVIMLDGITFGGFNVVDISLIFQKTGVPVIVVMRKYPNFEKIRKALQNFENCLERWALIKKAGDVHLVDGKEPIYIQMQGIDLEDALEIVQLSTTRSAIPEPLRAAHIIAAGLIMGESKGSA